MSIRAELLLFAGALGIFMSLDAEAAPRRARAVIETCTDAPFTSAALLEVLPLELGRGVTLVQTSTAIDLLLTIGVVDCSKSSREVALAVMEPKSGLGTARTIRVDPGPGAPRVVAVAIAELARALELEIEATTTAPAAAKPRVIVRPDPLDTLQLEEPRKYAIAISLGVEAFPSIASAQPSLSLSIDFAATELLLLEAGVSANYAVEHDARGEIDLGSISPFLAARARGVSGALQLEAGPRLAVGWSFASGRSGSASFEGRRIDGVLAVLWLDLQLRWPLSSELSIGARASAGYVLAPLIARADGAEITGIRGAALGFGLIGAYHF